VEEKDIDDGNKLVNVMDINMVDHDHYYVINTAENHYFNFSVISILDFNVLSNNEEVSKIINNKI